MVMSQDTKAPSLLDPIHPTCMCVTPGPNGGRGIATVTTATAALWEYLDIQLLDGDLSLLAHAPGAANGLLLQGGVQGGLQNEHMVGGGQVDAHRAAAHGQQEHCGWGVLLEGLDCLHTIKQLDPGCCTGWPLSFVCLQTPCTERLTVTGFGIA